MACSINLQDKAIRNIRVKRRVLRSLDEVLAEINSIPELSSYTLDKAVEEFTGNNLVFLQSILESFGYKYEGSKINKLKDRKPKSVTDIDSIFSSPIIDDLFDSLHIARQYFKNKATRMLSEVSTLNEKHQPTYTEKNSDLNKNIKRLKNELFETVVRFLKNNGVELDYDKYFSNDKFIATLYGTTWNFHNYNLYKEAIKALEQFLLGPNNENAMTTLSKHTIPNIRGDIRKAVDRSKFDAYNAAIMLANFDSIVTKFFGKTLTVDYSSFNDFSDGVSKEGKYLIKRKGDTEEYFSNGTHAEEGAQTNLDELSERVINMMSHYDRFGQETGLFLDTSDFYSLASFIREFERKNWAAIKWMQEQQNPEVSGWTQLEDNPTFMLKWYIDQILKADANGFDPKQFSGRFVSFKHRVDIIQSIKKFIEPLEEKEKNSKFSLVNVITQMLTNSYGANYMIFNAKTGELDLKEMHSHNALRVDIQNSIYSHLLDTYSDIDRYWSNIPESERFDKSGNSKTSLDALTAEKEIIAKQVDSDSKLSFYIKHLLGIYVGTHGASTLREKWGESLPTKLQDILKAIRGKVNGKTLHEKILENETLIANQEYESAITPSTIIEEVSKNSGIQDILDVYLDNFILRPIMNIKTLTGEQIPTYKLANLMYSDTSLMLERHEIEKTYDGTYKNLFVNIKSDGLLGTSTGLEVINKDVNKSSSKLNIIENFNAYFKFGFIDSFRPGSKAKGIHTLIANYADKSTIMSKIISLGITHDEKLIIGKAQSLSEEDKVKEIMTMDEVLNLFRTQSLAFYTDLLNDIFDQYRKLNPELAKKLKSVEDNNPENFNHNINVINEYLGTFSSVDSFLAYASNMQKQDTSIKLTEELHYSFYNNKSRIGLNQTAVGYYQIFRDTKLFNEFVRKEEESFMNKLIAEKGEYLFNEREIALMNKSFFPNGTGNSINVLLNAFGIKSEDYSVFSKEKGSKISITPKEGGFRINPILKRWMWTSNLFRNEYLNLSIKPEFMHPHKSKSIKFNGNTNFNDPESFFKEFRAESSKRIPNMSKRNVSFTATYENGLRNSRKGSPSRLNVAVIKDFVDQTYNLSGKTNKQDIHDGSSMIPYVYSRMIEESYPGKGYNGTKKRIATFITEFGSALKKDAETVITNDKIRRSVNSPIKLGLIQRKALGTIPLPTVNEFSRTALPTSGLYYRNGAYYKIHEYTLKDGYLTLRQSIRNPSTNSFELIPDEQSAPIKVNNLYDIWFAFGAEASVDVKADGTFGFSEGSNELLYDLIINATNNTGEYALKSGMIHIISNASAFKSGATNINLSSAWTDDNDLKLSYTTYNGRYIGPQLDAGHEADASKIKEITQIISALSQNPKTAQIAKEVYDDLAKIIEISAEPYIKKITNLNPELKEKYYKQLSLSFAHALSRSDGTNLARTIAESFGHGALLPFSNQSFFREFTRDLITKMNNEFIVRYYNGLAMVLNPSHGIIQIYEDSTGKIYAQDDLMLEAFNQAEYLGKGLTNSEILTDYLNKKFPKERVTIDKVMPGGNYENELGKIINVNKIEDYYEFKEKYNGEPIYKVYNKPRDLKPSEITFEIEADPNPQVVQLFESNPELANAVYEALGFGKDTDKLSIQSEITPQQKQQAIQFYSSYLDTIFPNSKVKDIVYRGSTDKPTNKKSRELGIFFTDDKNAANIYAVKYKDDEFEDSIIQRIVKKFGLNPTIEQIKSEIAFFEKMGATKEQIERDAKKYQEYIQNNKGITEQAILNIENPKNLTVKDWFDNYDDSSSLKENADGLLLKGGEQSNNRIYDAGENQIVVFQPEQIHILGSKQDIEGVKEFVNKPNPETLKKSVNLFDTEPVRLRYVLNKWSKNGEQSINQKDLNILNSLAAFWKIKKDSNFYFNLGKKLNAWSQRNLHLLDSRRIMKSIDDISFKNDKGEIDVSKYFGNDTLINKRFDEVEEHYILNNSIEIKNYSFKPAELMMPNIYASIFDNEGVSIKQILDTVDESGNNTYFESKVRKIYDVDTKEPINADLKLILSSDERPVYIKYVDNFPPVPVNTKMLRSIYNDELGETVLTRLNTKGEIVYTVPNNSRIIKEDDYDVVYLKIGRYTKIAPLEGSEKAQNVSIISYDFEENLKDFIKSFKGGIQAIIPLMSNSDVGKVVSERSVKSLIEGEPSKLEYLPVDINNTTYRVFKRFSGYTVPDNKPYGSEWFNSHKDDIIKQLGLKKFISWQKSNEVIASRIPAQSMQSFMEMRNVSYVNTESNDGYVSIWQIWLQGSDFDIDKAYIMAYSFDKNGKYVTATDVFDYSSKEQLDAIESLPFPLGKEVVTSLNQNINQSIDISSDFEKIYDLEINNPIFNSESTIEQILHNNLFNLNAESIKSISNILRKIKRNSQIFVSEDIRNRPGAERILESLVKVFNIYNADESYVKKSNSIKNSVVSKIRKIISSPSNQLLANEPVSVQELHDAGDKAKKALGIEDSDLSMWDMLSPYKQQLDASIGKADVGIGANGLKVYYALSNYYNSYYNSLVDIGNIRDIDSQEYLEDPKSFEKVFTLKTEVSPDVFENRTKRIFTIANTDVPTDYIEGIMNAYGYDELKKEEAKLSEESAALIASGFVSGATDNAKELVMAKINAVESLASMHLYLISLGYSIDDIAIYMNSKLAKHVANKISGNLFETSTKTYLDTIIEKYVEDLQKKLQSEKEKYKANESPEIAESIQNIQNEIVEAIQFKDIYDGGQEFKVMASILKVNQKTSANINELNKFLGKLESAVFAREHAILGHSVIALRNPNTWNLERNIKTNGIINKKSIIEAIISANPLLRKMENATSYVTSILTKASDIEVSYIDNKGMTQTKQVSLVGGQFDFRYYMNPENIEYRNAAMEYYNLFKNTINIFDVIEGSPHFKAMIDGVSVMHSVLSTYSSKYNMAFNMIRDVVRKYSKELAKNEDVSHKFLNEAFPIDIDEFKLGKVFRTFDNFLISKWTKSVGEISKFRFSVKQLLQIAKDANAGVNSVVLFRNNLAKEFSNGEVKTYKDTSKVAEHVITVNLNSDEDFIVDLTSDYGIANFKILMEEVIFKILKTSKTSSLANTLKLSLVKNAMNIPGNQIVSTFNISELNSPINMEKYQELLTNFNDVDKKVENPLRIVNAENKRIAYKDLLYIYNLTVNNEMYGNKRLTPLFDDYIKHKDSIGRSYLDFSTLVDSGEVDIFEVDESLDPEMQNELKEYQAYSILHSIFNKKGSLKIGGKGDMLAVKNSHFVINTMSEKTTTSNFAKNATLESVLAILRNNNLIINFKCD